MITSFVAFCQSKTEEYKKANPAIKSTEITKQASKDWAELPED